MHKTEPKRNPPYDNQPLLWPGPRGPLPYLSVPVSAPRWLSSHNSEPAMGLTSTVATPDTTSEQGRKKTCPAAALLEATWEISPLGHLQASEPFKLKTVIPHKKVTFSPWEYYFPFFFFIESLDSSLWGLRAEISVFLELTLWLGSGSFILMLIGTFEEKRGKEEKENDEDKTTSWLFFFLNIC